MDHHATNRQREHSPAEERLKSYRADGITAGAIVFAVVFLWLFNAVPIWLLVVLAVLGAFAVVPTVLHAGKRVFRASRKDGP